MEVVEEPPLQDTITEAVKANVLISEDSAQVDVSEEPNVCQKSNGVSDTKDPEHIIPSLDSTDVLNEDLTINSIAEDSINNDMTVSEEIQEVIATEIVVEETTEAIEEAINNVPLVEEQCIEGITLKTDSVEDIHTEEVEVDGIVETMPEGVRFETEIMIETNVVDQSTKYQIIYDDDTEHPDQTTDNILNELGQNIELSDVLRSSDISENVENNNCDVAQEVFNKEELLDILEGNDIEESRKVISENFAADCKSLETQLALQQLSRLKQSKRTKVMSVPKKSNKKLSKKSDSPKEENIKKRSSKQKDDGSQANSSTLSDVKEDSAKKRSSRQKDNGSQVNSNATPIPKEENSKKRSSRQKDDASQGQNNAISEPNKEESLKKKSSKPKADTPPSNSETISEPREESVKKKSGKQDDAVITNSDPSTDPKEDNIVNALVKDWEDDEPSEAQTVETQILIEESDKLLEESVELVNSQDAVVGDSDTSKADASVEEEKTPNVSKSETESQPQRRLGRVIKKKVIFDPDNPDTYIKSKIIKKEIQSDKDQPTPKRIKTDQTTLRSKSKSPIQTKLQWKKPQPKNLKQNKRLTEIDRLLMDEGAVNMICQLTPEAPQGNKNMKSKAEFIKKIQSSSTPEGKEMKFRERIKKELKGEEGDPRRIGGGKERHSLGGSVKSPSVSEDFEAHSADDSIIYRRHSSSSYSSPCMSPRRLSDVESLHQNINATPQQPSVSSSQQHQAVVTKDSDSFMADTSGASNASTVINKTDFLSIKEKLNSKLSQAMNKRKRENSKIEKPTKIKKILKTNPSQPPVIENYKYIKLTTDQKLAEICVLNARALFNIEVMNELRNVLETVESRTDISVTLLKMESSTLHSGLDLSQVLDQEKGENNAFELAESARALLVTLESHKKLVCTVVEDRCHGLGLGLVALSDVTVASESATFELSACKGAPLLPGAAALTARGYSQSLINDLVVMERVVSAAEALRGGLVTRTVWSGRALEQARAYAADLAAQPHENVLLKKQLLRLKRGASESFLTSLQIERDLFVNYWISEEGRQLVRASLEVAKE